MRPYLRLALGLLGSALLACSRRESTLDSAVARTTPSSEASSKPSLPVPTMDSPLKTKALYFPNATIYGHRPGGVQEISLPTADGLELNAWYLPPAKPDGYLLLYFHGNGGNLSSLGPQVEAFSRTGAGVLAIDYRGYGKSPGLPSEAGLYVDSEAAYRKALELGYKSERIVIYGRSLGGGVATYLATRKPAAALILESTFTSVGEVAKRTHGAWAANLVSGFPSLKRMPEIAIPTFILHGSQDKTIPADMAEALRAASPGAELWLVDGADHNSVRKKAGESYVRRLRSFFDSL